MLAGTKGAYLFSQNIYVYHKSTYIILFSIILSLLSNSIYKIILTIKYICIQTLLLNWWYHFVNKKFKQYHKYLLLSEGLYSKTLDIREVLKPYLVT